MATRFYLPSSGAAGASPSIDPAWNQDDFASRVALVNAKSNTALTDQVDSYSSGAAIYLFRQYVSNPIGVVNFNSTTVSAVVRGLKNGGTTQTPRISIRLFHRDGTFTTLLALASFDSAFGTSAATRIVNAAALANAASLNGDRLVVEIGISAAGGAPISGTLRFGDPTATADFALTSGLTTDLDPWVELSANIPPPVGDLLSLFH